MKRIDIAALVCLAASSITSLFVYEPAVTALLALAALILLGVESVQKRRVSRWLPICALCALMNLMLVASTVNADSLLTISFIFLLAVNVAYVIWQVKKEQTKGLLAMGIFGKVCMMPAQLANIFVYTYSGYGIFAAIAYSILLATSVYVMAALYGLHAERKLKTLPFLLSCLGLLIPGLDWIASIYAYLKVREHEHH
jgi:asparagine N-glycosylation enzyme membrane subunit Stt3